MWYTNLRCAVRYRVHRNALRTTPMIALFFLGLAAVAVGPALTLLLNREDTTASEAHTASAGMFAAVNDNTDALSSRAA